MTFFKHAQALVESETIGKNTRVWAFAHILPGARIGADCNICDHVFIENDVVVGDRVTIKCGVQLWDGVRIEDDAFVGPNVTFTNNNFPRSKQRPEKNLSTLVRTGATIGANATILAGLTIGKNAMVGAGAVVTRDVPPHAIVIGNPASIKGYVNSFADAGQKGPPGTGDDARETKASGVAGVTIHAMPTVTDMRGSLSYAEYGKGLPFAPRRYFTVFDVPSRDVRGEHAHKTLHQFLLCLRGGCSLVVDDGVNREEIVLDSPAIGVHLSPLVWGIQYKYTPDAILLVLASDGYDADDYIRDYDAFLEFVKKKKA
jgi:acetyltransferase-like isoleucine patch superfamily enzyme